MTIITTLRALIPTRTVLQNSRWLRWLAPWLGHPKLWQWSRRGVAMGVALGVFFGLLLPLAQIPVTAAAAIVLRANLPAAAASTLISNPLTLAPLYWAAFKLGSWLTGEDQPPAEAADSADQDKTTMQRLSALGKPLLTGLFIMAGLAGLLTYWVICLAWRCRTVWRWRSRRRRHQIG
ncbi:MAG: DUF2062 domain-containing protein [Rhodoferax sp.]